MKTNSINSTSFKGMIVGKTTEGKQVAIRSYEIDRIEPIDEKTTQCGKYSYEEKKYIPVITFNAPMDAVLKAYSKASQNNEEVVKI